MNTPLQKMMPTLVFLLFSLLNPFLSLALDLDGDGINNAEDNCMAMFNPDQQDSDDDGFGDVCDFCEGNGQYDIDGDGLCDKDDNCYSVPNPDQQDSDGDGKGDVCKNNLPRSSRIATFKGSYEEIGRQVAHTFPDLIIFLAEIFTMLEVTPESAQSYYETIEDSIPQSIKDHMKGMAKGLTEVRPAISLERARDMVLVNSFAIEELNKPSMTSRTITSPFFSGCTAFAISSEAGTFLCHNTDGQSSSEHMNAIMHFVPDNGDNSYLHIFTPGFVDVGLGLNDKGIGITFNLGLPNTHATPGLPVLYRARYVMEKARTLNDAINYFIEVIDQGGNYGTSGGILLLVDFKDSSLAKLQIRSETYKVTYGEKLPGVTYVAATNHFDDGFRDDPDYYYESSWARLERLLNILPQYDVYDLNTCWEILSDTEGGEPNANTICRKSGFTITTVTNIFTQDTVYYTLGPPCEYLEVYKEPITIDFKQMIAPCFVELVFGENAYETQLLRNLRDHILRNTPEGRELIRFYYDVSPIIVNEMTHNQELKRELNRMIEDILGFLKAIASLP